MFFTSVPSRIVIETIPFSIECMASIWQNKRYLAPSYFRQRTAYNFCELQIPNFTNLTLSYIDNDNKQTLK